jgi:hypothetical protein
MNRLCLITCLYNYFATLALLCDHTESGFNFSWKQLTFQNRASVKNDEIRDSLFCVGTSQSVRNYAQVTTRLYKNWYKKRKVMKYINCNAQLNSNWLQFCSGK